MCPATVCPRCRSRVCVVLAVRVSGFGVSILFVALFIFGFRIGRSRISPNQSGRDGMGASKSRSLGRGPPTDAEWTPPPATPDTLPLTHLCEDALLEIMRHCGIRDLGRLAQTCIFFDELLRNRAGLLWARKANAAFGTLDRRWRNLALRSAQLSVCLAGNMNLSNTVLSILQPM